MTDSPRIARLRQLAGRLKRLEASVEAETEAALREGEFAEDIADALGWNREKLRRFRVKREIPEVRLTRRSLGMPERRDPS